jgi:hypothetical protein
VFQNLLREAGELSLFSFDERNVEEKKWPFAAVGEPPPDLVRGSAIHGEIEFETAPIRSRGSGDRGELRARTIDRRFESPDSLSKNRQASDRAIVHGQREATKTVHLSEAHSVIVRFVQEEDRAEARR